MIPAARSTPAPFNKAPRGHRLGGLSRFNTLSERLGCAAATRRVVASAGSGSNRIACRGRSFWSIRSAAPILCSLPRGLDDRSVLATDQAARHQLPDRRLRCLRLPPRTRTQRSRAISSEKLDGRPGPSESRLCPDRYWLHDEAPTGRAHDRARCRHRSILPLGCGRHRLQAIQLKQWRRGKTIFRELTALGARPDVAVRVAGNARSWRRNSGMLLNSVLTIRWADQLGLPRLA